MSNKIFEIENVFLNKETKNGIAHILNDISFSVEKKPAKLAGVFMFIYFVFLEIEYYLKMR